MVPRYPFRAPFVVLLLGLFLCQGCGEIASPTSSPPVSTVTTVVTLTATSTTRLTQTPIPTSTLASSPTPVPLGTLVLFDYVPFVMNYDPLIWEDKSNYKEWEVIPIPSTVIIIENYLQVRELETCKIMIQGPTEFNEPYPYETVRLGDIEYTLMVFKDSPIGFETARYIAHESPTGNYPTIIINASNSEASKCKALGGEVLSTLHIP